MLFSLATAGQSWLQQALTSKLSMLLAGIVLVSFLIIILLFRAMVRLGGSARHKRASILRDEQGTTSMEMVLAIPVLLLVGLIMVQAMMMMAGNLFVHYSAFQATRQATMVIPMDFTSHGDYGENFISNSASGGKWERIRTAAYLSLVPVAGRLSGGSGPAGEMVAGVQTLYGAYGHSEPNWIDRLLEMKVYYANEYTRVKVMWVYIDPLDETNVIFEELPESPYRFGCHDVVAVQVRHELALNVPVAGRFFMDGEHDASGEGRFAVVEAMYMLPNEGVNVAMPEAPSLQRITPPAPRLELDPNDPDNRWRVVP